MSKLKEWNRNWDLIYKTVGDGLIPECEGAGCGFSCCDEKIRSGYPDIRYRTCLMGKDEYRFQNETFGDFEEMSVKVDVLDPAWPNAEDDFLRNVSAAYVVGGCSDENKRCKLRDRKPFICRVYPLGLHVSEPLVTSCPKIEDIFENPDLRERIFLVRRLFGYQDNQEWMIACMERLNRLRTKIQKTLGKSCSDSGGDGTRVGLLT